MFVSRNPTFNEEKLFWLSIARRCKRLPPRNTPMKKSSLLLAGLILSVLTLAFGTNHGFNEVFGPLFHPASNISPLVGPRHGLDSLHRWNVIAINATGLDHTPVAPGENRVFGEQLGPGRASRAMAIVHIAMFDAIDAVVGGYQSYTGVRAPIGQAVCPLVSSINFRRPD